MAYGQVIRNAKRKRKFRISPNQPTPFGSVPDLTSYRGDYGQWPITSRMIMAGNVMGVLKWEEQKDVMLTGKMPDTAEAAKRLGLAYQKNYEWALAREAEEAAARAQAAPQAAAAEDAAEPANADGDSDSEDSDYELGTASVGSSGSERSEDEDWEDTESEPDSENSDGILYADDAELPDAEQPAATAAEMPSKTARAPLSYAMIKEASKKYAKRMLQHQTFGNVVKNGRGYKLQKHRKNLEVIKDMVVNCWRDEQGNKRMFKNLEEVEQYDKKYREKEIADNIPADKRVAGPSFAEVKAAMGVSTRTIWHQLKALYKMRRMRLMLKRRRDEPKVQVCSTRMQAVSLHHCSASDLLDCILLMAARCTLSEYGPGGCAQRNCVSACMCLVVAGDAAQHFNGCFTCSATPRWC